MASLGHEMPEAIKRAIAVRDQLISLRGMPNTMVEPQIMIITAEINRAIDASASGEVVAMLQAYEAIKGYEL
jgi:hypothetical protein